MLYGSHKCVRSLDIEMYNLSVFSIICFIFIFPRCNMIQIPDRRISSIARGKHALIFFIHNVFVFAEPRRGLDPTPAAQDAWQRSGHGGHYCRAPAAGGTNAAAATGGILRHTAPGTRGWGWSHKLVSHPEHDFPPTLPCCCCFCSYLLPNSVVCCIFFL